MNGVVAEFLASAQEIEFENEGESGDYSAEFLYQLAHGGGGPAGSQNVVDDQHPLAGFYGVGVEFENIGAIFKSVLDGDRLRGKLFRLADGDEASAKREGHGWGEEEAARLNADYDIDRSGAIGGFEARDYGAQPFAVLHQSGDVVEIDAWLREIWHFADERFQMIHFEEFVV